MYYACGTVSGSTFDWRYVAPCLSDDVAIIRLELPGHGESPRGARDAVTWPAWSVPASAHRGVAEAEGWDAKQPLDVFALAHSLGSPRRRAGDPAAELEQRTSDTRTRCDSWAAGWCRRLGCSRAAIRMIAGATTARRSLLRPVLRSATRGAAVADRAFLWVNMMGFERAPLPRSFWMIGRAAASDYGRVRAIYGRMRDRARRYSSATAPRTS